MYSSLWDRLNDATFLVWSCLNDEEVIRVMYGNHSSIRKFSNYPFKKIFKVIEILGMPSWEKHLNSSIQTLNYQDKQISNENFIINTKSNDKPLMNGPFSICPYGCDSPHHRVVSGFPRIELLSVDCIDLTNIEAKQFFSRLPHLKRIDFYLTFNQRIPNNILPKNVSHMVFNEYDIPSIRYYEPLTTKDFPINLLSLQLPKRFNETIQSGILPHSLTELNLGGYNQSLATVLLSLTGLLRLTLISFNQTIKPKELPQSLIYLYLGRYNNPIQSSVLSYSLQELTLVDFDQSVEFGVFPNSLKSLKFERMNHNLPINTLPKNLAHLQLPNQYEFDIEIGYFPHSLVELILPDNFNQSIQPGFLPAKLEKLTLGEKYNLNIDLNTLPSSLKHISLSQSFNQPILTNTLPSSLQYLSIGKHFNQSLTWLPNLTHLHFYSFSLYNQQFLLDTLPSSLIKLTLGSNYNHQFTPNVLPHSITHLTLGNSYNRVFLSDSLPKNLTYLSLGDSYNQYISNNILPSKLLCLKTGHQSNQMFNSFVLPKSIYCLDLTESPYYDSHPLNRETLPESIISIKYHYKMQNTENSDQSDDDMS